MSDVENNKGALKWLSGLVLQHDELEPQHILVPATLSLEHICR